MKKPILGLDFGGVIRSSLNGLPMPSVLDSILILSTLQFGDKIWIISRIDTDEDKNNTLEWLDEFGFTFPWIIPKTRIRFCRFRKEKAEICQRLGITHFVDNRPEVLHNMQEIVPYRILFNPDESEGELFPKTWLGPFYVWAEVRQALLNL